MKFGWGRKKDPPPIFQRPPLNREFKLHSDSAKSPGVAEFEDQPQSTRHLAKEYFSKDPAVVGNLETWEERLQETIRFVFSHEQEGLLAIGTFALDQLAGVTSSTHITDHKPPRSPAVTNHHSTPCRTSSSSSTTTTHVQGLTREVRSSDDEPDSITNPESDYPVFGDPGSVIAARPSTPPPTCKAPLIEIKATTASSGTEHVQDLFESDQEFYSPALCGLFASRSRRLQKRKKPPQKMKKGRLVPKRRRRLMRVWGGCGGPVSLFPPESRRRKTRGTRFLRKLVLQSSPHRLRGRLALQKRRNQHPRDLVSSGSTEDTVLGKGGLPVLTTATGFEPTLNLSSSKCDRLQARRQIHTVFST